MIEDYAELKRAIEDAGFFTTFMPIRQVGDRMVCCSHQFTDGPKAGGLGGRSFWVAKRDDGWYVATWSPSIYRVSRTDKLVALCLELLRCEPSRALFDLAQEVVDRFELVPVTTSEFDGLETC
jgi:hypothetical protein